MPTRVYQYGLLDPTSNADVVNEQIYLAHRYRNVLTEIEREYRTAIRTILGSHPDTEALSAEVSRLSNEREQMRLAIRVQRQKTRSRSEEKDLRVQTRALNEQLKAARTKLKEAKREIGDDPIVQTTIQAEKDRKHARIREERARCGVFWGTYLLVEDAAERASREKMDPKFLRYTGEGRIGVQIQGGMAADELPDDRRMQLDPIPAAAHDEGTSRGERRQLQRTRVRLRVGSDEHKQPVWAEWPIIFHRPLPEGGRIKAATVSRDRRDCRRWRWSLIVYVELPEGTTIGRCGSAGRVAVNPGWRQRGAAGLRVGCYLGDDGREGEILLPSAIPDAMIRASGLRSVRDQHLDQLRAQLATWLRDHTVPEWLRDRSTHLSQWRSAARFASLARVWKAERFAGDDDGYALLETWRYRDEHLQRYEAGLVGRALRRRREEYRLVAVELATCYHTLVLDDTDYRTFQRSPEPESERIERDTAKLQQRWAAPSELRSILRDAFLRRGGHVVEMSSLDVTRTCHGCGSIEIWNQADEVVHTCAACSLTWDQDANAVRNLLARERSGGTEGTDTARSKDNAQIRDVPRGRRNRKSPKTDVARKTESKAA